MSTEQDLKIDKSKYRQEDQELVDKYGYVLGEFLGSGTTRRVYRDTEKPDQVIKVSRGENGIRQNVLENEIWCCVAFWEVMSKWFTPVVKMHRCCQVLVMMYAENVGQQQQLPDKIPSLFTDLKPSNFGIYNGHFAAIDYGVTLIMPRGITTRMKKPKWRIKD